LILDHIGIAVKNITATTKEYELLGFKEDSVLFKDNQRNLKIQFISNSQGYRIELIETMDVGKYSPIKSVLEKNNHCIYHTCYKTKEMVQQIENMRSLGYVLISKPELAVALHDRKVCFLYHKSIGLIELVEYD
jgi:methylmalonyl-CoA/ethylmalonyl-CoA epimerase